MNAADLALAPAVAYWKARALHAERIAYLDEMTGLRNRRGMYAEAQHGNYLFVTVVDADGLKRVNDEQGHAAGDAMLKELAGELTRAAEAHGGFASRTGGDEFVLLTAERPSFSPELRASVGTVLRSGLTEAALDDAINAADAAMYEHKRARRAQRTN